MYSVFFDLFKSNTIYFVSYVILHTLIYCPFLIISFSIFIYFYRILHLYIHSNSISFFFFFFSSFFCEGTQSSDSPISIEDGWTWLIRFSKQLEIAVKNGQNSTVQECSISLLLFLRQASAALIKRFGWKSIRKVFEGVRTVAARTSELSNKMGHKIGKVEKGENKVESSSDAEEMLIKWLDSAISSEGVQCTLLLRHFEPHVMAAYRIIR